MYYWLLILLLIDINTCDGQFRIHLYHSDRVSADNLNHDCLLYEGTDYFHSEVDGADVNRWYQIIPYCIRHFHSDDGLPTPDEQFVSAGALMPFQQLIHENVTSEILYLSSMPIDAVERYQAFLDNSRDISSKQKLYNCSLPWFGEFWQ